MKKALRFTLLTLIILSVLVLVGCLEKEDKVSSISLKDNDPSVAIEIAPGEFDFSRYTVLVSYESGAEEKLVLSEEMMSVSDLFKLHQVGEHEISVNYGDKKYTFKVLVKRATFGEISFPENNVFTYDGKAHTVEVEGDIPANAVVTYLGSNSFVNVGTYDVTALIYCDGYDTKTVSTTVKIERARYDMSGVKFEAKEFVYDGKEHRVEVTGDIPEGLSAPKYTINEKNTNGAVDVGEYKVIATFTNNDPNYEAVENMETTLTITPAEYTLNGVEIIFKTADGKIIEDASKVYDGLSVVLDLNDYNKIPDKVSVSFSISDEAGKVISESNKNTNIVDVGIYTVTASFTASDSKNYKPIDPIAQTFEVKRADYILSGVTLSSASTVYDGNAHSIAIEGTLPENVTVSYEYYLGDTLITDGEGKPVKSVFNAGRYTVKANFTHTDKNRGEIDSLSAVLQIMQAEINVSDLSFKVNGNLVYDGTEKWVSVDGEIPSGLEVQFLYYINDDILKNSDGSNATAVVNAGAYSVLITVIGTNDNYLSAATLNYEFLIEKAAVDVSGVEVLGLREYIYDGSSKLPSIKSETVPENVNVTQALYSVNEDGYLSSAESAVNSGSYAVIYTLALDDSDNYRLVGRSNVEWYFSILPQTIEVGGVNLSGDEFNYDGSAHAPTLSELPSHVLAVTKLYSVGSSSYVSEAINAGEYRCVVTLKTDSSNYALSSDSNISLEFEIIPVTIALGDLEFDALSFTFDENSHKPTLLGVPEHVVVNGNLFSVNSLTGEETYVENAVDVGKYRYKCWLAAESLNYVLSGNTSYTVDFTIKPDYEKINIDEMLNQTDFYIELPFGDGLYHYNEDDPIHTEAVLAAICGPDTAPADRKVKFEAAIGVPKDAETGKPLHNLTSITIVADRIYTIECRLSVTDTNKYIIIYDGKAVQTATVTFNVKFVENLIKKEIVDVSGVEVLGLREYIYDGSSKLPSIKSETVPENVNVTQALYSVDEDGHLSSVESAVNSGSYAVIYTLALDDSDNYHLVGSSNVEWYFSILPQTIDVSGVNLSGDEFNYDGSAHAPTLSELPSHVLAETKLYSVGSSSYVSEAINAGEYRCVVTLKTDSSNYALSSDSNISLEFEIIPVTIALGDLEFDALSFTFDENSHKPTLLGVPEHVVVNGNLFSVNSLTGEETCVENAVDVGKYRYKCWLAAESLNYVLSGNTSYTVDFTIKPDYEEINIDEMLNQTDFYIELPFGDGLYHYNEDDPIHTEAILAAICGPDTAPADRKVKFEAAIGVPKDAETGKPLHELISIEIVAEKTYTIECRLSVTDTTKYIIIYDGKAVQTATVTFNVKFVENDS